MLETVVIVLSVLLLASIGVIAWLVRALCGAQGKFYEFADSNADRWSRSHSDLADKVLSHSDAFLDFKRITETPADPPGPPRRITRPEPIPEPEWSPQGAFEDNVKT